jgi:hypothetical protein
MGSPEWREDKENLGATSLGRFQRLTRARWRCVPEGRLESRPAIYRRYWLKFDFVPEGRSKIPVAKTIQFSKGGPSALAMRGRYSGVPPGRKPA